MLPLMELWTKFVVKVFEDPVFVVVTALRLVGARVTVTLALIFPAGMIFTLMSAPSSCQFCCCATMVDHPLYMRHSFCAPSLRVAELHEPIHQ